MQTTRDTGSALFEQVASSVIWAANLPVDVPPDLVPPPPAHDDLVPPSPANEDVTEQEIPVDMPEEEPEKFEDNEKVEDPGNPEPTFL